MSRYLHVASGTATTSIIEAAGIPGQLSIWADPLYEGPVPALTDPELLEVRTRFLGGPPDEPVNDLALWRAAIDRHDTYDELILWYEHDLFDQLNLIQLLPRIHLCVPPTKTVSLICIGSFPGRTDFKGLGELEPGELGTLLDTRRAVGAAQYAAAERAWDAFRQPTPHALDELRREEIGELPYLARALHRFLQEYPWTIDGLSRTERRLLQLAAAREVSLSSVFPRMHEGEDAYYVTDLSLASMADELARMLPPLLTVHATGQQAGALHKSVSLTDTGHAVLEGRMDRIELGEFDRWLGGVHLQTGARIWRWDDARQRIT